ncbi:MAG: hypothetical protein HY431_00790 [Candidatus Levybacteria bacterium]|nr:hypothetical protein [Candidatus Levybacteria bacterium]
MNLSNKDKIMDISVNLARVSDWIFSENQARQRRVDQFLQEIRDYLETMHDDDFQSRFKHTLQRFRKEFEDLVAKKNTLDKSEWAEQALTWANILQHRAKLA